MFLNSKKDFIYNTCFCCCIIFIVVDISWSIANVVECPVVDCAVDKDCVDEDPYEDLEVE